MQGDCAIANEELKAILLLNVTLAIKLQARAGCCFEAQWKWIEQLRFKGDTIEFTASKAESSVVSLT